VGRASPGPRRLETLWASEYLFGIVVVVEKCLVRLRSLVGAELRVLLCAKMKQSYVNVFSKG
jgi:hypothetical protein